MSAISTHWHAHHHAGGTGHVYQGRFKAFPVQSDEHVFTVLHQEGPRGLRGVGPFFWKAVADNLDLVSKKSHRSKKRGTFSFLHGLRWLPGQ